MPTDLKLDYIELPALDLDKIENFYHNTFNWQFTEYGPEYRAFTDGKMDGGFFKSDLCSTTENGAALVILFANDLESTRQSIIDSGGKLSKDIFSFFVGRRFKFLDPHGNELAVWSDKPDLQDYKSL